MPEEQPKMYGKSVVSWETWEHPKHDRSLGWYIISGTIGVILLIYAVLTGSFPFAVVVLMIGIISLISHLREPERIKVYITTNGVLLGRHFYPYKEIKDFSIVFEPPKVKLMYIDFVSPWHPLTSVPLEVADPNEVRQALLPYAVENLRRDGESLTDLLARVYKL